MNEPNSPPTSVAGSQLTQPLRGFVRDNISTAVLVILVGWLSWIHWPAEQIIAVLLVVAPQAGGTGTRS